MGDLNEPRGSASVSLLAPGGKEAYAQAGAGYVATFPREHPLLQIDQVLTGPRLKATDYRVLDPGVGRHWMQWARVEAR
jgi:endonuclease/exonuclease/phosphatase family metal-dependent hydrolase